jgi:phosphatidylinositol glycan class P protein
MTSKMVGIANKVNGKAKKNVEITEGDRLAKESDVMVGGDAVPPETEYYGFAMYVGSSFVVLVYILWAFLPRSWLHAMSIYYYPSRWWAVAFPSLLLMTMLYIYVALASYNVEVATRPLDSPEIVTDEHAKVVTEDVQRYLWSHSDGVWDIPISEVNKVLYSG